MEDRWGENLVNGRHVMTFFLIQDDLTFCRGIFKRKTTSLVFQMKDDLMFSENGRQPQYFLENEDNFNAFEDGEIIFFVNR